MLVPPVVELRDLQPSGSFKLVDPDGLLATGIGLQPVGREMLATADLVAE